MDDSTGNTRDALMAEYLSTTHERIAYVTTFAVTTSSSLEYPSPLFSSYQITVTLIFLPL